MRKCYSSILAYLTIPMFYAIAFAMLACTDTVVTQDRDPSAGEEDGGLSEGGAAAGKTSECEGTTGDACIPCSEHGDCGNAACDRVRGRCVPCINEGDTTIGCSDENPVCAIDLNDSTKNRCVECATHEDCTQGACEAEPGRCVPCLIDDETTIGCTPEQPVCDIAENNTENRCVGCLEHSDCENGACDTEDNRCVPCLLEDETSIGCDQDSDTPVCKTEEDATENQCVGCLEHDDCATDACDESRNTCVACLLEDDEQIGCDSEDNPLCKVDDDDSEDNACVECLENSDCLDPGASACDLDSNQCTGCSEHEDCDGIDGLGACDDGECVECTDSETHCSDTTPVCDDNECRSCESHEECGFAGEVCNPTTGACYQSDEVVYVDHDNCESNADGSRERLFCQVNPAIQSVKDRNSERTPILVRTGSYSSFTASDENLIWIIAEPDAVINGNASNPAIWIRDDSDVIIEGLEVSVEESEKGVECEGKQGENPASQPTLVLRGVTVTAGAFGVKASYNCSFTLENSEFIGNADSASIGVDLDRCSDSSDVRVDGNKIYNFGNGIRANNYLNNIQIENNTISHSAANGVFIGGGQGTISLYKNTIDGATLAAVQAINTPGRIALDANKLLDSNYGLLLTGTSRFELRNNIIAENGSTKEGGGVLISALQDLDDSVFHSNTVVYNETIDGYFGGVSSNKPFVIENSIIWGNTPTELSDAVQAYWCIIGDDSGDQSAEGNQREKPDFVDPANFDFHLQSDSPGIDQGGSRVPGLAPDSDIDGDPRPQGDAIDIGADEAG